MLLVRTLSGASHVHVIPVMKAPARLVRMLMSVQRTHITAIPRRLVPTRSEALLAHVGTAS